MPTTQADEEIVTLPDGMKIPEREVRQIYNLWLMENAADLADLGNRQWKNLSFEQRAGVVSRYDEMRDFLNRGEGRSG